MEKSTKIKPLCEYHCEFEENPSISMSSKILVKIPAVLRKLCPMCPTVHVSYCPCALLPMCPIAHVPYCPYALLPMCPTAHVPYPQGPPSLSAVLTKIPFTHVPHCPCATLLMCQKDVKLSKRCQMSKSQTHRLWRRFTKK